jgi:hypothetical protein
MLANDLLKCSQQPRKCKYSMLYSTVLCFSNILISFHIAGSFWCFGFVWIKEKFIGNSAGIFCDQQSYLLCKGIQNIT